MIAHIRRVMIGLLFLGGVSTEEQPFDYYAKMAPAVAKLTAPLRAPSQNADLDTSMATLDAKLAIFELNALIGKSDHIKVALIIRQIGDDAAIGAREIVREALANSSNEVVVEALGALPKLGPVSLAELEVALKLLAENEHPSVRAQAMRMLAENKYDRATPLIIDRVENEEAFLADAALAALHKITREKFPAKRDTWQAWYDGKEAKAKIALPRLRIEIASDDPIRMIAAMRELVEIRTHRVDAYELIAPLVEHRDQRVMAVAGLALKSLIFPMAFATLERSPAQALISAPSTTDVQATAASPPIESAAGSVRPIAVTPVAEKNGAPSTTHGFFSAALVAGIAGAIALLLFNMRARNLASKPIQTLTQGTRRVTKAIKKRITFSS